MPLDLLTFSDVQHIIAVRFCLIAFLAFGFFCIYKNVRPWIFLLGTGFFAALAYMIFADNLPLMFWGLQGDEVTIAAMYNTFAHVSFFSDFAYHNLPPFYPPLFFWIFAIPGKIFNWNGVQMAKVATASSMLLFPVLAYAIQSWYRKMTPETQGDRNYPAHIAFFLAPLLVFLFIDWDAFILKPYEAISAFLSVLWMVYLGLDLYYKRLTAKRIFVYGLAGGILFLTYYLWLIFAALGFAFFGLSIKKEDQWYYYGRLFCTAVLVFLLASPYIVPLALSYHTFGSQNFQMGYFVIKNANFVAAMFEFFSWRGMFLLGGFISLLVFRSQTYIRLLLSFFASAYTWYGIGLVTLFFYAASNQEFKGFYFLDRTLLAFACAYGIEKLWQYFESTKYVYDWKRPVLFLALSFLSTQMIFGFFMNDPVVLNRRQASTQIDGDMKKLSEFLNQNPLKSKKTLVIQAGIPQLLAFAPINNFLYYNIHNSHPAANFSKREDFIVSLSYAKTSEELSNLLEKSVYGDIGRFIFFRNENKNAYELYYNVDNFPQGGIAKTQQIPKILFREPYFKKVYENNKFLVFDRNINQR